MKLETYIRHKHPEALQIYTTEEFREVDQFLTGLGFTLRGRPTYDGLSSVAVAYSHKRHRTCELNVWCAPRCFAYMDASMVGQDKFMVKVPDKSLAHDWLGAIVDGLEPGWCKVLTHGEKVASVMARRKRGTHTHKGSKRAGRR